MFFHDSQKILQNVLNYFRIRSGERESIGTPTRGSTSDEKKSSTSLLGHISEHEPACEKMSAARARAHLPI